MSEPEDSAREPSSSDSPTTNDQPTENPLSSSFAFQLTVPPIEVKMVNAVALSDYELWLFASSLMFSAAVGFFVAYAQSFHTAGGHQEKNGTFLL